MSATASGAASVSSPLSASPGIALSRFVQVTTSGQMRQYPFTDLSTDWRSVKAQMFLTPTNDLYYVGTQIASSVVAAVGYTYGRWNIVDYVLADGSARSFVRNTTAGTSTDSAVSGTPVGSTPVGALGFIDSNNDLYYSGSKIASGVSHCVGYAIQNSYVLEYVVASSGAMRRYTNNKASGTSSDTAFSGVPVDSVPLGARSFLAPSKDLYHGSTQVASGVSSAVAYTFQGSYVIEYVLSANGSIRRFVNDTSTSQQTDSPVTGIPSGSTPVGAQMYITPSNDLYFQQTRVATGVSRAIGYTFPTEYIVEYVGTPVYEGNVTC